MAMNPSAWGLLALYLVLLLVLAWPLGRYLAALCAGRLPAWMLRTEAALLRLGGQGSDAPMRWTHYAYALLAFNLLGVFAVYALQRLQGWLPLNPQAFAGVSPDSAFNTAISFVTNTNWQGYSGESTMSYLTQMLALTVQNFLSAATGMAVVIALIRGFARHTVQTIGNFWVDITRSTLYILLPLSFIFTIVLMGQGVIQNFDTYKEVTTLQATTYAVTDSAGKQTTEVTSTQTLPMGPVASQEAIKMIGTNGGGFFNANSAHPYENPTPLTNFLQMIAIFLIPAALCITFGKMVGDKRQGWAIFSVMTIL